MATITYPVTRPTVSGQDLTVDLYSKQPLLMLRTIQTMIQDNYWLSDVVFNAGGTTASGAVVYQQVTALDDQFTDRSFEDVAPGAEFPVVGVSNIGAATANTQKRGAKMQLTREMISRNDISKFRNSLTAMMNTAKRTDDAKAIAVLGAASYQTQSQSAAWTTSTTKIRNDIFGAIDLIENSTLGKAEGYRADTLVLARDMFLAIKLNDTLMDNFYKGMSTDQANKLLSMGQLDGLLGIPKVRMNPFLSNGTRWVLDSTRVGKRVDEYGLELQNWYDDSRQTTWYQLSNSNVFVVEHPKAIASIA